MNKEKKYPKEYLPLDELIVCSNKLNGGGSVLGINDFAPLLIGSGDKPFVWLYMKNDNLKWVPLIEKNISFHTNVIVSNIKNEIIIKTKEIIIVKAKMISDKVCDISEIDLRPIGFNVYGIKDTLHVATNTFRGNIFKGLPYMFRFDINE